MELSERFKDETGKDAYYEMEDRHNCNRSDMYPKDSYVEWLEELVEKLEQL